MKWSFQNKKTTQYNSKDEFCLELAIMIRSVSLLMSSLERVDPGLPSGGSIDDISDCSVDIAEPEPAASWAKIYSLLTPSPGIMPPCLNGVTEHGAVEKKLICGSVWHWAVNESLSHWEYWDWCRPHRESAADKAVVCPKQSRPSNEIHYKEGCLGNWYQEFVLIMSWLELARIPDWAACKILI